MRNRRFQTLVVLFAVLSIVLIAPILDGGTAAEGDALEDAAAEIAAADARKRIAALRETIAAAEAANDLAADAMYGDGDAIAAATGACEALTAANRDGLSGHEVRELDGVIDWICAAPYVGTEEHALLHGFVYYLRSGQGR